MAWINNIFAALALLSFLLALWQWVAALRFPLHERRPAAANPPPVTLLKPLKGCDDTTAASLQSWLEQYYVGETQILFGVADASDPVCEVVRGLLAGHLHTDTHLVICGESLGANAKVSTLIQLERLAKHELILISDADVRVPADFLEQTVDHLSDPHVGLANCFYRLANPQNTAMQWEAIAVNADFWSQVLQSATLQPPDFALGAAMLVRREALAGIGGFTALADCLADDYQLGHRIAAKGYRITLGAVVVDCWDRTMDWTAVWKHQLRWARTIRVCQPLPYFLSILSNATLWPLLWLVAAPAAGHTFCAPLTAAALILFRIVMAGRLQRRLTPRRNLVSPAWLVPVKDLLQVAVWASAFLGNTIEWRGEQMRLRSDGTLVKK